MDETYFYEPGKGHGLPHDPFKVIVALRPIGWLSTVNPDGRVNLAPTFCRPTRGYSRTIPQPECGVVLMPTSLPANSAFTASSA
jgi:hypothetical protein